jgi:outer membrane protein assembly factor BamB
MDAERALRAGRRYTAGMIRCLPFSAALLVIAASLLAAEPEPSKEARWPGWRGSDGQGVVQETGLPLEWTASKNVVWKSEIPGRGYSSPIVWGDRIFLTTAIEGEVDPNAKPMKHTIEGQDFVHPDAVAGDRKHTFEVIALDAKTGKILWERTAWKGTPYDSRHRRGSFASPTPVTDGSLVYAYFGGEGLFVYDFDGKLAWKFQPGAIGTLGVGVGTSPLLYKNVVILQCDEENGEKSFVVGLDKKTGKEVWRVLRKIEVSWATPVLVRADGRDELVTAGSQFVIAYDPATGKELWRMKGLESNAVPSPVAGDDVIVVSAGYPEKIAIAIRPGGSGDITGTDRVLWTYKKGTAYVPSPILYDGFVYLMTDKGLITCLDAKTGEVKYEGARMPVPASFMASPVALSGSLLFMSQDGDTFVVKAGPKFEVVGTNPLDEPISASAAAAPGRLFIRGEKHLFAIGLSAGS